MPAPDMADRHALACRAGVAAAWEAGRTLRIRDLPLMRLLFALRRLPGALFGARAKASPPEQTLLAAFVEGGFRLVAEKPGQEVVYATVGQFWKLAPTLRPVRSLAELSAFHDPGFLRAVMSLRIEDGPGGCRIVTETRVQATDDAARRRFRPYWWLVHPGSALIRREWLRAIARRAECAPA